MPIWKLPYPEITFHIQNRDAFCFINIVTGFAVFSRKFIAYTSKLKPVGGVLYIQGCELWFFPPLQDICKSERQKIIAFFFPSSCEKEAVNLAFCQVRDTCAQASLCRHPKLNTRTRLNINEEWNRKWAHELWELLGRLLSLLHFQCKLSARWLSETWGPVIFSRITANSWKQ